MRITGGTLCGRRLKVPKRDVRPTQDRVRESLFSILTPFLDGCRFLDLFAGTGVVGLEAWSRGADYVCWVECDRNVFPLLKGNVEALSGLDNSLYCMDAVRFLKKRVVREPFNIIFADPPYTKGQQAELDELLKAVSESKLLADGGLFIYEQAAKGDLGNVQGWEVVDDRVYGATRLRFYRESGKSKETQEVDV